MDHSIGYAMVAFVLQPYNPNDATRISYCRNVVYKLFA